MVQKFADSSEFQTLGFYVVEGLVHFDDGSYASNVVVKAFHKQFQSEMLLGETQADQYGYYKIIYSTKLLANQASAKVNLFIHIYDQQENLLGSSTIYFDVPSQQTIDLTIARGESAPLTEYEQLSAILPDFASSSDQEISEDDLKFLVQETGKPKEQIAGFYRSIKLHQETGIPAELYYALAQKQLPLSFPELLTYSTTTLQEAIETAIHKQIIPEPTRKDANKHLDSLHHKFTEKLSIADHYQPEANLRQDTQQKSVDSFTMTDLLKGIEQSETDLKDKLLDFFSRNPEFDLKTASIDTYLQKNQRSIMKTEQESDELIQQLRKMQRVYRLTPSFDSMISLLDDGVHSAYSIVRMGKGSFVETYSDKLGGEQVAAEVFGKASQAQGTALALFSQAQEAFHSVQFSATDSGTTIDSVIPNWNEMFGSFDWCDCDQCQSVNSPAAYLVDILHFLSKCPSRITGKSALDILLQRRPDIGLVELSCDNTNIAVPYIDLVNEILENAVSPETAVPTNATTDSAEEVGAVPEHVNIQAYNKLSQEFYPWSLPYDLWSDEVRTYLGHVGVNRANLMEDFKQVNGSESATQYTIAQEVLQLSPFAASIITGTLSSPPAPYRFWGFATDRVGTEGWMESLRRVPLFLERSGLSYPDLEEVLLTRFINPNGAVTIHFIDETHSLDQATVAGLTADMLERTHRFIRLQRQLGWSIRELDKTISALKAPSITKDLIIQLAAITRLQAELQVPLQEILSWYSPLDTDPAGIPGDCLYASLFANKLVVNPIDQAFALREPDRTELANTSGDLRDHLPTITAAFQMTSDEFSLLVKTFLPDTKLHLLNLSTLYRNHSFARALELSTKQYTLLRKLTALNPFVAGSIQNTLTLLKLKEGIDQSGFTIEEFAYLLTHQNAKDVAIHLTEEQIAQLLETFREQIRTIRDETVQLEPTGEWIARTLATIYPPQIADQLFSLIASNQTEFEEQQIFLIQNYLVEFIDPQTVLNEFSTLPNPVDRFAIIHGPLQTYRLNRLYTSAIKQIFGETMQIDADLLVSLIYQYAHSPASSTKLLSTELFTDSFISSGGAITAAQFSAQFSAVQFLHKLAVIFNRLKVNAQELAFFFTSGSVLGWPDWNAIPVQESDTPPVSLEKVQRIISLLNWRNRLPVKNQDWNTLLSEANRYSEQPIPANYLQLLSERTGWDSESIRYLAEAKGYKFPNDYKDERFLLALQACFSTIKKLDTTAQLATSWAATEMTNQHARDIRQAVKARYDKDQWVTVAKALKDPLRETQRTKLVSYLESHVSGSGAADDLFAHFLIDVEMSASQMTSRIKQAISSVQLFVQRSLMNLEPSVSFRSETAADWKTMKNYRVWEANRKIFLYPENWLEPDLRDNKSSYFQEMENDILQNEATLGRAKDSFLNYLEKLDQVSRFDVCGAYHEYENRGDGHFTDILHVFARTQNSPYSYYYRRFEDAAYWTPWEKVDVDIEGDHLVPVIYKSRLYLFWPVFTEEAVQTLGSAQGSAPVKYKKVSLAWSEFRFGKWTPSTKANVSLDLKTGDQAYYPPSSMFFHSQVNENGDLIIYSKIFMPGGYQISENLFHFQLNDPHGTITASLDDTRYISVPTPLPLSVQTKNNKLVSMDESGRMIIPIWDPVTPNGYKYLMADVLGFYRKFTLVYPQNGISFSGHRPFFYQDSQRVMFIHPLYRLDPVEYSDKHLLARTFYHPHVNHFVEQLYRDGIDGLLRLDVQTMSEEFFLDSYSPNNDYVAEPYPANDVDFSTTGPYSLYNWELFFHAPLMIADRLSKNQQFEEAQKWFHYIFDPTDGSTTGGVERFWKMAPLHQNDAKISLEQSLRLLHYTGDDPEILLQKEELEKLIDAWRIHPFNPHLIARLRISSYQKAVVMKYLDNLITWADSLFRQDNIESINEATQLYVLAAELLGKRPQKGPKRKVTIKNYQQLAPELDDFSNALVQLENLLPPSSTRNLQPVEPTIASLGTALYFAIPHNEKLLSYWDVVADRLFKIRHSMSIDGTVRQLPLFQPPIDPGLLAKATAAGVDLSSALQDIGAPVPLYRYGTLSQKAGELCAEVKAFGSALLSAMEKRDSEELAQLRSNHEVQLLSTMRIVKENQIEEARETLNGLYKSKDLATIRVDYYKQLIEVFKNSYEEEHLNKLASARKVQLDTMRYEIASQVASQIPNVTVGTSGIASPVLHAEFGGANLATGLSAYARFLSSKADGETYLATKNSILGGYERRREEWQHQQNLAEKELEQLEKQILAAQIRLSMTEKELQQHDLQTQQSREVNQYMRDKFTNRELYDWLLSKTSTLYFQSYQMAYDAAKRAERAYQFELGSDKSFIQFGHWDGLKKGLLAGEKLSTELRRMDLTYYDQNKREYEISKSISIGMLDPLALALLKETGECYVDLPESLFDLDYPGHYRRRIKSVSLTIPCVTGPYTTINSTLTLIRSSIRKTSNLQGGKYSRINDNDIRFLDQIGVNQSIVTSSGQHDSGVFELAFKDDRYLPFEGAGAISKWRIELARESNAFDVDTVSDIIMHLNYTAKDGGAALKTTVLSEVVNSSQGEYVQMVSAKQQFSGEWHRFFYPSDDQTEQKLSVDLTSTVFPFKHRQGQIVISQIDLFLKVEDQAGYASGTPLTLHLQPAGSVSEEKVDLISDPVFNGTPHILKKLTGATLGKWAFVAKEEDIVGLSEELRKVVVTNGVTHYRLKQEAIENLWMMLHYKVEHNSN